MPDEEVVSAFAAYGQKKKKKSAGKPKAAQPPSVQNKVQKATNKATNVNTNKQKPIANGVKKGAKKGKQKQKVQKSKQDTDQVELQQESATPTQSPVSSKKRKNSPKQDAEIETPKGKGKRQKLSKPNGKTPPEAKHKSVGDPLVSRLTTEICSQEASTSSQTEDPPTNDSIEDAKSVFSWVISPVDFDSFFEKFWEKKPCLIQRNDPSYFSKLISCAVIDQMLINNHIEFTKNIDITSYENGVRVTLNPEGRATPPVIWGHYEEGCSIRLLNPQTFIQPIYAMNATLQDFFHCMVGTNVYLTPPNSQGFAPHYDDIEAFVLQIEGQKRWKLYNPRNYQETLARFSSPNFTQDEIGEPILDEVLKPGDVLYFPRGTIHQACTQPGYHSLHVTLSMYQKHSYADLFEILVPKMISRAIQEEVDLRRGLPLNIWQNLGKIYMGDEEYTQERDEILAKCEKLMQKVLRHADLDEAVDLMAKRFQHDALPPALTAAEKRRTIFGAKISVDENGAVEYDYEITLDTHVRLIRANVLRVVEEEESIRIYYYVDNSKEYHEYEPNFIEIEPESVEIVKQLVKEYPEYICTSELEAQSDDVKLSVVQGLYERGLLMVDEPMA